MSKPPRSPRSIARSVEVVSDAVAGRAVVPRVDPRQPDLFALPFVEPCKPTLAAKVPVGSLWQYEIKHDGYRAQAHVQAGAVRIFTKSGLDWADRMPWIRASMLALDVQSAVIDGEAVMAAEDGSTNFFAVHAALAAKRAPDAFLMAFDLLELNGTDLRPRPLVERRTLLAELLASAPSGIEFSEALTKGGVEMLRHACEAGLEGIIAKRRDTPYRSGRSETWLKIKCTRVEAFAVVGFDPQGRSGVASLKLATLKDGVLVRCGSVGSGIGTADSAALRALLDAGGHVVADVEFRGWTPAGELRHPVFRSHHED